MTLNCALWMVALCSLSALGDLPERLSKVSKDWTDTRGRNGSLRGAGREGGGWRNISRPSIIRGLLPLVRGNDEAPPSKLQMADQQEASGQLTLRVAAEEWVPHIAVSEDSNGKISIRGPMANLLNALASSLKFKYVLVRPPDGAWGIPNSSGDWNGMIGMVKRNEADLALGPFGLTYSRSRVVDFSSPILIDYYRILVKRPRSEVDPWGFLRPYSWGVWVGLLLSLFASSLLLYITIYSNSWMVGSKNAGTLTNIKLLLEKLYELYAALLTQPFTWISTSTRDSVRVAVCFWLFVALIFGKVFGSSLTSLLAVRNVPIKYNFLRQVIDDPKLNMIFEKATALVEHMSKVERGIYKELADAGKDGRSHFLASSKLYDAAYTDVRHKQYALLVEDVTCRKVFSDDFTKYGRCDFYIGKEKYWPLIFCMIGRKGSPLMRAINEKIGRMTAHDLYFKWLGYELPNATACLKAATRVTVNEAYNLTGLWGVFTLFSGGIVLSFVTLALEVLLAGAWK